MSIPKLFPLLGLVVLSIELSGSEAISLASAQIPDPTSPTPWSDSYSVGGQCYCDTNFDHGLAGIQVATAQGNKSVPQICADIAATFGSGPGNGRIYYNTVQCGHGPRNNAADEAVCPGIPRSFGDYSGERCQETGATWNLERLYGSNEGPGDNTPEVPVPSATEPEPPQSEPTIVDAQSPEPEIPANQPTDSSGSGKSDSEDNTDVATGFPECSNAASDDNGDGYGWENSRTCVVTPNNNPDQPTTTPPMSSFPECSASVQDDNGDGYGWENEQSCLIVANNDSPADDQPTTTDTPALESLFPACSASVIDDNGDGFGWENEQSCLIVANNDSPADDQPTMTDTPLLESLFPACSASVIDDNSDGFGWENDQSCLITAEGDAEQPSPNPFAPVFPDCSEGITDEDGDGYAQENDLTCKIPTTASQELEFPACSDDATDEDGDGYGWENEATCQVTPVTQSTNSSATKPIAPAFPSCSRYIADYDDDGYGWENEQTCLIQQ
jgi:hypothetical protein